jgi:hypothetical protein
VRGSDEEPIEGSIGDTAERRSEQTDRHQEELDFGRPVGVLTGFDHHAVDEPAAIGQKPAVQDVLEALANLFPFVPEPIHGKTPIDYVATRGFKRVRRHYDYEDWEEAGDAGANMYRVWLHPATKQRLCPHHLW